MEAAGELDQLLHVLQPPFGRLRPALPQHGAVAGRVQQQRDLVGKRRPPIPTNAAHRIDEAQPGRARPGWQVRGFQGSEQRHLPPRRLRLQRPHRLVPEPARRNIDHPPQGLVGLRVVRCRGQSQQRQHVLDLGTLIEPDVADQHVGDACPHQRLLEAARELIAAVEHRHVVPGDAFGVTTLHLADDAGGFGVGVPEADHLDAIAVRLAGKQRLAEARTILRDHGIGGVEDVAGRAKILFQLDLCRARKVPREASDVGQI